MEQTSKIRQECSTKPVIKDMLVSAIPKITAIGAGILTSILLARGLGAKGLGEYTLIMSIATLIPALSDLGINQSAIRFASQASNENDQESQNAVLRWAFRIRTALLIIITAILLFSSPYIAGKIWHIPHLTNILKISLLIGIFSALSAIPTVYFQSLKKFKTNALVQTLQTIIAAGGIVLIAILNKWSVNAVIISSIIATMFSAIFFFHIVPKQIFFIKSSLKDFFKFFFQISKEERIKDKFNKEIHSFTFWLIFASVICTISSKMDVYLMGYFLDTKEVGLYSIALRLLLPLTLLTEAYRTQLWPKLVSSGTDCETNKKILKNIMKPTLLIALSFAAYSIIAPLFIPMFFGEEFRICIMVSQFLCFRAAIELAIKPISTLGYNYGLAKWYTAANFVDLIMYAILYCILMPKIGIWAVVVARYMAYIVSAAFIYIPAIRKIYFSKA